MYQKVILHNEIQFCTFSASEENFTGVFGASNLLLQVSKALGILPAEAVKNKNLAALGKEKEPAQQYKPNSTTRIYRLETNEINN
jgi:hypothetical protein